MIKINGLIPRNSSRVINALERVKSYAESKHVVDYRVKAVAFAALAVLCSACNAFLYTAIGVGLAIKDVVHLHFRQGFTELKNALEDTKKSVLFSTLGAFYVFSSLFFPSLLKNLDKEVFDEPTLKENEFETKREKESDNKEYMDQNNEKLFTDLKSAQQENVPINPNPKRSTQQLPSTQNMKSCNPENLTINLLDKDDCQRVIKKLQSDTFLDSDCVSFYSNFLEKLYPKIEIVKELQLNAFNNEKIFHDIIEKKVKNAIKNNKEKIFIPFVLQNNTNYYTTRLLGSNLVVDHLVVLCLDVENNVIEFYNAQGDGIQEEDRYVSGLGLSAKDFHEKITELLPGATLKFNSKSYQQDRINCATYVCNFIEKRSFKNFDTASMVEVNPKEIRKKMELQLKQYYNLDVSNELIDAEEKWNEELKSVTSNKFFSNLFIDANHPAKLQKYALVLEEYKKNLETEKFLESLKPSEGKNFDSDLHKAAYLCIATLYYPKDSISSKYPIYEDPRTQYRQFVELLDKACDQIVKTEINSESQNKNKIALDLIKKLCHVRWTSVEISQYLEGITLLTAQASKPDFHIPNLSIENFSSIFWETNGYVENAPNEVKKERLALLSQQFTGEFGLKNYTGGENTPNKLCDLQYCDEKGNSKKICYLRHGSPTTAGTVTGLIGGVATRAWNNFFRPVNEVKSGEKIVSNYLTFLDDAAEKKQGLLYVVHQRKLKSISGNESERVDQILNIEKSKKNFFALVQPVEGDLFDRKGRFEFIEKFDELKRELLIEFFPRKEDGACKVPDCLNNKEYREVNKKLLDSVHKIFFDDAEKIDPEHWQTFLLIFYVFQKIDLKFRLEEVSDYQIAYYTTPCKDFLDRGGNMAFVEIMLHLFWNNKENDSQLLKSLLFNIIGAAILVKKKGVIEKRMKPGLKAVDYMHNYFKKHTNHRKELTEMTFGSQKWRVDGVEFKYHEKQTACPSFATVKTKNELQALLSYFQKNPFKRSSENQSAWIDEQKKKIITNEKLNEHYSKGDNRFYQFEDKFYDGKPGSSAEELLKALEKKWINFFCQDSLDKIAEKIRIDLQLNDDYKLKALDQSTCKLVMDKDGFPTIYGTQEFSIDYINDSPYA